MSDSPQGPYWWVGVDGQWYPPELWTGPPDPSSTIDSDSELTPQTPSSGGSTVESGQKELTGRGSATPGSETSEAKPSRRKWPLFLVAGIVVLLAGLGVAARTGALKSADQKEDDAILAMYDDHYAQLELAWLDYSDDEALDGCYTWFTGDKEEQAALIAESDLVDSELDARVWQTVFNNFMDENC